MRQKWGALWVCLLALTSAALGAPTPTPIPQIIVPSVSLREGNGGQRQLVLPVKLSKASPKSLQVKVGTKNGTARAGQDYLANYQTITFAPGTLQSSFAVTLIGDTFVEPDETFFIVASAPGYTANYPAATCTLRNDDSPPNSTPTPKPTATTKPTATPRPTATPTATPTPTPTPTQPAIASIRFVAYADTWADARERWWDIGSKRINSQDAFNGYNDWVAGGQPNGEFDYSTRTAGVVLTYQKAPNSPYFIGHISARGLKPNFAYQLKLTGKPVNGPRGSGTAQSYILATDKTQSGAPDAHTVVGNDGQPTPINGDDWTNQQLGYVGRWWNDSNASGNTNAITDAVYQANTTDTIYGYQFIGDFVTDAKGNAETDVKGDHSYHITWQDWQNGIKDAFFGTFPISGFMDSSKPTHYYGYGGYAPATGDAVHAENGLSSVGLWYELQSGRTNPVVLPSGTYHCRMLITEETFHNMYGETNSILGGKWKTVMATEDRDITTDEPDTDSANDIVFTIR